MELDAAILQGMFRTAAYPGASVIIAVIRTMTGTDTGLDETKQAILDTGKATYHMYVSTLCRNEALKSDDNL